MKRLVRWMSISLVLTAVLFAGALTAGIAPVSADEIPKVTPQALKQMIESKADVMVVDNQPKSAYDLGHVPGAVNFPWEMEVTTPPSLPKDKPLVFYCACGHEEDAMDMANQLREKFGYDNIKLLDGGWIEWVKLGFPVEK